MLDCCIQGNGAHVLLMGLTFKENCRALRNTRVIDVIRELQDCNVPLGVYDPLINPGARPTENIAFSPLK